MKRLDAPFLIAAAALVVTAAAGCLAPGEQRGALSTAPQAVSGDPVDRTGDPVPDGGDGYQTMCGHYCQALHDTLFYYCIAGADSTIPANDATACASFGPTAQLCYDDRCVPMLVTATSCLMQCDSLDREYRSACRDASTSPPSLCPTAPDDHDSACRAACQL
jgi:hypothetical protein